MPNKTTVIIEEEEKTIDQHEPQNAPIVEEIEGEKEHEHGGVVRSLTNVVRWFSNSVLGNEERKQYERALKLLENSTMFRYCSEQNRAKVLSSMSPMKFKKGDVLMTQGEKQKEAFLIIEGTVSRKRLVDGQFHTVGALGYAGSADSIGMLHLLEEEPSYSSVIALSDGLAFVLPSQALRDILDEDHVLSNQVIHSLIVELRRQTYLERTPLFLQSGKDVAPSPLNWFAVSVAASIESFYRSGLNAILIRQLTGKPAPFFPNMHIQLPTRILYINGFKGIRALLEQNVDPRHYPNPQLAGLTLALIPGIVMTPISSVLESSNVTHMNNEHLARRWTRGLVPRTLREVVFGVGINQLSDFWEERFDNIFTHPMARNFAGSLTAGAIAGYLSHVPHNLSMLKLLEPHKSYATHFENLRQPWNNWWKKVIDNGVEVKRTGFSRLVKSTTVSALTIGLPKGCLIRTAQISGSFIIINSTINTLKHINVNVTVDPKNGVV